MKAYRAEVASWVSSVDPRLLAVWMIYVEPHVSYVGQFEKVLHGLQLKTGQHEYRLPAGVAGIQVNGSNVYYNICRFTP